MRTKIYLTAMSLTITILINGCSVMIHYTYRASQQREIGQGTTVEIAVVQNYTGFSNPKNIDPIKYLDVPLVDAVRDALSKELVAAGFVIGPADRQISVDIYRFLDAKFQFIISSKSSGTIIFARAYEYESIFDAERPFAGITPVIRQFLDDPEAVRHLRPALPKKEPVTKKTDPPPQQQQMQQQMMGPTIVIGGQTVTGEAAVKIKEYGVVNFQSNPDGAEIYIENNLVGNAPISQLKFEKGSYNITAKMRGYKDWKRQILVIENSTITIKAELEKKQP